jgi:putative flippase GtrA
MDNISFLLRFLLVGGSTAAIYFGLSFALVEGFAIHVTVASTIACIAANCYNYALHYHWTFASNAPHGRVLKRYLSMVAGGVLLNGLVMQFGAVVLSMQYMLVQLIAVFMLLCWSISISSLWVFKKD